jgi:polysaccharide biosynthesis transport protein
VTDIFRDDESAREEPDQLRDQVRQLARHRAVIAAGLVVGLCGGLVVHQIGSHDYAAEGQLLVRDISVSPFDPSATADKQVNMQTEVQVAGSLSVADAAADALKENGLTGAGLKQDLSVSVSPDSQVMQFTYTAGDPAEAARRANALMDAYLSNRRTQAQAALKEITGALKEQLTPLENRYDGLPANSPERASLSGRIATVQGRLADYAAVDTTPGQTLAHATAPTRPAGAGAPMALALGGVAGAALGILLAWLLSVLEAGVRDDADVRRHLGAPVLATLPVPTRRERRSALAVGAGASRLGEAYRALALRVTLTLNSVPSSGGRVLLVVEPRAAGHCADVAANLAAAFAESGEDVLLIEADLRHPRLYDRLAKHLSGNGTDARGRLLPPLQVNAGSSGAFFLVPGRTTRGVRHALAEIEANAFAHRSSRTIVVSAPAALDYPDALAVARWADGIVVVCPDGGQRRADLDEVREFLGTSGTPVLGAVLRRTAGGSAGQFALRAKETSRRRREPAVTDTRPVERQPWESRPASVAGFAGHTPDALAPRRPPVGHTGP